MKNYNLKKEFILSEDHKNFLESLPGNFPETVLTKKQKDNISSIYYQYISKNQVYKGWSIELYKIELSEKWPSGPRVKQHEAMRMILGNLLWFNKDLLKMNESKAARHFLSALQCRESYQILTSKVYELK